MLELKSKYFNEYYGTHPYHYDIGFIHYNIDISEETEEEYKLIEEDISNIYNYLEKDLFKIYFSNIKDYVKAKNNIKTLSNYNEYIYIKIRTEEDLNTVVNEKIPAKIIIDLKDIDNLPRLKNNKNLNIIIQIDYLAELSLEKLKELKKDYNITYIEVGQITYLSTYFIDYLRKNAIKFNVDEDDYLNIEKNILISNDFYTLNEYEKIYTKIRNILSSIKNSYSEIEKFMFVYSYIIKNIVYDKEKVNEDLLEDQNLIGGLLNNKCVCEGYTKILQQLLKFMNIESIVVGGGENKIDGGHLWNQVKIDNTWYNADATVDAYNFRKNLELKYCLVNDDKLSYKTDYPIAKKCSKNNDIKRR